jgi:hypothetical protein
VTIIWGLDVQQLGLFDLFVQTEVEKMWSFDGRFDPADPWTQRSMMSLVESVPSELGGLKTNGVWIHTYERWLQEAKGVAFPSRDFHATIAEFILTTEGKAYRDFFLVEAGWVKATKVQCLVDMRLSAGFLSIMELKRSWDRYIEMQNELAGVTSGQAFHVSQLWVRAEAQEGILTNTALSIGISIGIGFLAAFFFAGDLWLAALCMVSVSLIILAQLLFMVVILGWTMGAVEVVALIVFLGYVFTFNLHIAHAYSHSAHDDARCISIDLSEAVGSARNPIGTAVPVDSVADPMQQAAVSGKIERCCLGGPSQKRDDVRFFRARYALEAMGRSIFGSASTSVGCSLFLLPCLLQFFVRFGLVILTITVISLFYALGFLPALLMVVGPSSSTCTLDGCRRRLKKSVKALREGGKRRDKLNTDGQCSDDAKDAASSRALSGDDVGFLAVAGAGEEQNTRVELQPPKPAGDSPEEEEAPPASSVYGNVVPEPPSGNAADAGSGIGKLEFPPPSPSAVVRTRRRRSPHPKRRAAPAAATGAAVAVGSAVGRAAGSAAGDAVVSAVREAVGNADRDAP